MPDRQLCICQICNCGRHRCPHRDDSWIVDNSAPCFLSEYESRYTGDPALPVCSYKPKVPAFRIPDVEMAKCSSHCIDYVRHPPADTRNFKPQAVYEEPADGMDLNSTYKTVYSGKPGEREKSYKPENRVLGRGQFRTEVTSHDYKAWPINPRQVIMPTCETLIPDVPFGNKSEAQTHFTKLDGWPADSMKPPQVAFMSTNPFDSKTSHQIDYDKKTIPARIPREKIVYQPPTVPYCVSSTYQDNYMGCPTERAQNYKPSNLGYRYGNCLTGTSTHKTDFVPLPPAEKFHRKVEPYEPADIPMDCNTTQKLEFQGRYGPAADLHKPTERKNGNAQFRCETTHGVDYIPWQEARREPIIQDNSYKPPLYPMDGKSEFQTRYLGDQAPAALIMRPPDHVLEGGQFSGETSYHTDYTKKNLYCPAEPQTLVREFDYRDKKDGHLFYSHK